MINNFENTTSNWYRSRNIQVFTVFSFFVFLLISSSICSTIKFSYGAYAKAPRSPCEPTVNDDSLTVEKVTDNLDIPTSLAFLGPNDILVTEKTKGKVMRIVDGMVVLL